MSKFIYGVLSMLVLGTGITVYQLNRPVLVEPILVHHKVASPAVLGDSTVQEPVPKTKIIPLKTSTQQALPEDSAIKIERCKTIAESASIALAEKFSGELYNALPSNLSLDQLKNYQELIAIRVKQQKGSDYNRFYLDCLN